MSDLNIPRLWREAADGDHGARRRLCRELERQGYGIIPLPLDRMFVDSIRKSINLEVLRGGLMWGPKREPANQHYCFVDAEIRFDSLTSQEASDIVEYLNTFLLNSGSRP